MSDVRFTMLGIALVFSGFLIFGIFGQQHYNLSIQAREFGDCYKFRDGEQIGIDCGVASQDMVVFFAIILALIGVGIFSLIKGVRGKWDQDVKQGDAVGPGSSFPS